MTASCDLISSSGNPHISLDKQMGCQGEAMTLSIMTFIIMTLSKNPLIITGSFVTLIVNDTQHNYTQHNSMECHYADCHVFIVILCCYSKCHNAKCQYSECNYAECNNAKRNYAECIMLSVISCVSLC